MTSARASLLRFRSSHAALAARQRELVRDEGPRPEQAVAESLAAINALADMGLWPGPRDAVNERGVEEVRRRWARIEKNARASRQR